MKGNIELKQCDGTQILPKDDAILYDVIVGQSGIIQGCELTWLGSNQVHINHGYGIIKGRVFEVADQTFYAKLPSSADTYYGYIVIIVDLENSTTPIKFDPRISETAITDWTQDSDMNFTNGKYEMPIAEYKATNSGITSFSDVTKKIMGLYDAYDDALKSLKENFQVGVDTCYNGCVSRGATPSAKTPAAISDAIGTIYTNRYNAGYGQGVTDADNRANGNSVNYRTGYDNGYNAGKNAPDDVSSITYMGSAYRGGSATYTVNSAITGFVIVQTANDNTSNAYCSVSAGSCVEKLNQVMGHDGYASQLAIYNISVPAGTVITFGSGLCKEVRAYLCTTT